MSTRNELEGILKKARKKAIKNPIPSNLEAYNRARDNMVDFLVEEELHGEKNSVLS